MSEAVGRIALAALILITSPGLSGAQEPDPFWGTRELDLEASTFASGEVPVGRTNIYEDAGNGAMRLISHELLASGETLATGPFVVNTWRGEAVDIPGAPGATIVVKRSELRRFAIEIRFSGELVSTTVNEVSADGMRMDQRITGEAPDGTLIDIHSVYRRVQPD
jgi:hypothetical protein